jgi:uncharacterized protein YodC (DUF2158 family)
MAHPYDRTRKQDSEPDVAPIHIGSHVRFFNGPTMIVTDIIEDEDNPEFVQLFCAWWEGRELHTALFHESLCIHAFAPDPQVTAEPKEE